MNCDQLPRTGLDANIGLFLIAAIACVLIGAAALLLARRRSGRARGMTAGLMLLVLVGVTVAFAPSAPAQAAGSDCASTPNSLTVIQTSTMAGLAPGVAPRAIAGRVMNNGSDTTDIVAVDVEITAITASAEAAAGTCDASDYILFNASMPVARTLGPGESVAFEGASIAFLDKATNQDACVNAVIHLLYTANPG